MGWWQETIDIVKENDPATTLRFCFIQVSRPWRPPSRIFLWKHGFKLPQLSAQSVLALWTQIEIHPGAQIDSGVYRPRFWSGDWEIAIVEKALLTTSNSWWNW